MDNGLCLRMFLICAGVFAAPGPLAGQNSPARISSGIAVTTVLGPVATGTLFNGDYSFVIAVPANAARLDITLSTQPATADVDLFGRRGQDVAVVNQQVVYDQASTGETGTEAISIPSPQPGDYYIALAIYTNGVQVTCSLKATVTPGTNTAVPVLPGTGVLNAADNTHRTSRLGPSFLSMGRTWHRARRAVRCLCQPRYWELRWKSRRAAARMRRRCSLFPPHRSMRNSRMKQSETECKSG